MTAKYEFNKAELLAWLLGMLDAERGKFNAIQRADKNTPLPEVGAIWDKLFGAGLNCRYYSTLIEIIEAMPELDAPRSITPVIGISPFDKFVEAFCAYLTTKKALEEATTVYETWAKGNRRPVPPQYIEFPDEYYEYRTTVAQWLEQDKLARAEKVRLETRLKETCHALFESLYGTETIIPSDNILIKVGDYGIKVERNGSKISVKYAVWGTALSLGQNYISPHWKTIQVC